MKLAGKLHPKHLFRSKKSRSVSRSDPSSFKSYATTSSGSPDHIHRLDPALHGSKSNGNGVTTPTSVLPTQSHQIVSHSHEIVSHSHETEISSDEWSENSSDVQFELVQAFKFIDSDGDGRITREELETVLKRIGGSDPTICAELSLMINEIDRDGDGIITLEEFGAISSAFGPPACDTELRDVFEFFDADHDGRITAEELFAVLKSLGDEKCTLEECRRMIALIGNVDENGDGFVCFEDFSRMMEPQQV